MTDGIQRRLAAILAADVAGYSRLMGADEAGTLTALRQLRTELFAPTVAGHRGKIVKSMGDGWLVEFASVVDAVTCAIDLQEGLAGHDSIKLRVGVHLGDVTHEEEDIFGNGVNIAARLQEVAQPGGIVISDLARRSIDGKLAGSFINLGSQNLKNIAEPITAYGWGMTAITADATALQLSDKPSIAVLPFQNMSGDPEQEYFSDGITEDIITALSKFRWFFVTARNSTFTYKGSAIDIKQVGRDLGVRYVLEGSVRKAGSRLRVSAQLIEASIGNHIWAERYDRELADIFELQDEITLTIAAAVEPELAGSERDRALHKPTADLQAWDFYQRGMARIWQFDRQAMADGAAFMHQALALDPDFGLAYAYLAYVDFFDVILSRTDDRTATLRQGLANARKALSIDQRDYIAHWSLGRLHSVEGDHQSAIREMETSISINPNFAHGYSGLSIALVFAGQPEKAIEYADMAIRLSPHDPQKWIFVGYKGLADGVLGNYEKAIEYMEEACRFPTAQIIPFTVLAALYALTGRDSDAAAAMENARRLDSNLSIKRMDEYFGVADPKIFEAFYEGFRKAGLT